MVKSIFPEASSYGKINEKNFSVPVFEGDKEIGFLFETYDVTRGLGYSRRPFNLAVGVDSKGFIRNVKLLKHVEPIAILGRTDSDFINYLKQYKNINLRSGVSLTLELTGADIEGDNIAMRETAGDNKNLTQVDGVSRTTTSSLLFMDAIMRGARKIAREKKILLGVNDIGNYIDLEMYKPQNWNNLIDTKSLKKTTFYVGDLNKQFQKKNYLLPRAIKYEKEELIFANLFFAHVSPAGIGINILGRRWFDQYVSAGRNVDDQVFYIAFQGENWQKIENRLERIINNKALVLQQNDKKIIIDKNLFKELPFNHAKKAPSIASQGLIYINSKFSINPQEPIKIIYKVNNDNNKSINLSSNYLLPSEFYLKKYKEKNFKIMPKNRIENIWKKNKVNIFFLLLTVFSSSLIFIFVNRITRKRKIYSIVRTIFLLWVLFWLGWVASSQISIIHLLSFLRDLVSLNFSYNIFIYEPLIFLLSIFTILSIFFCGRMLFCGWLCPFGAFQELIANVSKKIGLRQIHIPYLIDKKLRYLKYILLFIILSGTLLNLEFLEDVKNIEPFKVAITLKFIASAKGIIWASCLLLMSLFLERAYCRFLCPLGGFLAIIGRIRQIDFLKRRNECGNPCHACKKVCPTGAIMNNGKINMQECLGCLDCQVMYKDATRCPPLVKKNFIK